MGIAPVAFKIGNDRFCLLVRKADFVAAIGVIDSVMQGQRYDVEQATAVGRLYSTGSVTGQVLLGGLSDRKQYQLSIKQEGDLTLITIVSTAGRFHRGRSASRGRARNCSALGRCACSSLTPPPTPQRCRRVLLALSAR